MLDELLAALKKAEEDFKRASDKALWLYVHAMQAPEADDFYELYNEYEQELAAAKEKQVDLINAKHNYYKVAGVM